MSGTKLRDNWYKERNIKQTAKIARQSWSEFEGLSNYFLTYS